MTMTTTWPWPWHDHDCVMTMTLHDYNHDMTLVSKLADVDKTRLTWQLDSSSLWRINRSRNIDKISKSVCVCIYRLHQKCMVLQYGWKTFKQNVACLLYVVQTLTHLFKNYQRLQKKICGKQQMTIKLWNTLYIQYTQETRLNLI